MIRIIRVYGAEIPTDGAVFLIDRLWPRGISKDKLAGVIWLREAAPSSELRAIFHHDPDRWEEFCRRYFAELESNPGAWQPLLDAARAGNLTLLYAARDETRNNAAALRQFLENRLAG